MKVICSVVFIFIFAACKPAEPKNKKPMIVSTTTMLRDLVSQIGGEDVLSISIMSPGGDPHLYQPTPKDVRAIAQSDLVIVNGLHLEGWIDDLVRNASTEKTIAVASRGVDPIGMSGTHGVDPHFWFDLGLWRMAARNVGEALMPLLDGPAKMRMQLNLKRYLEKIAEIEKKCAALIKTIPKDQRVLVTSHDAFAYFGRAFGMEVVPIQGISTEQEASNRDVINVIEMIRKRRLKSVFIETSVNPSLVKQVAKETGVNLSGPLYSDSIGIASSDANTLLKAILVNVKMITKGLRGDT